MISSNFSTLNQNNFNFNFATSSGDKIDLELFDHKSLEYEHSKNSQSEQLSMSLRHAHGYSFHYEGNGIDNQDRKEIEEALKEMQPLLVNYFENIEKSNSKFGIENLKNDIQAMKSLLPTLKEEDSQNFLKDKLVDSIDETLQLFEKNNEMIEQAKKLFDVLMHNSKKFDIYG